MSNPRIGSNLLDQLIQAIIGLLAGVVDRFKAKNPFVFVVIQSVLFTAQYVLTNATDWGLIQPEQGWVQTTLQVITWLLTALVGSRTFNFLNKKTA